MKFFLTIGFFIAARFCFSQEPPVGMQDQLEELAAQTENETQDDDGQLLQLEYYKKHPLNINTATIGELQKLRLLSGLQIAQLVRYRQLLGKLIDIHELQAVPSWDLATIKKIVPYIVVGPAVELKENFLSRFRGEHTLLFRVSRTVQKSKAYDRNTSNSYLGDPNHLLFRYRYQYKNLLGFGLLADKDAGEPFFKSGSRGFDFYSLHFFARELGKVRALALGDYQVNLGQGLTCWRSMGFGKSAEVISIKRQSPVLLPYRSAGEFQFNRGAAVTFGHDRWEATVFFSRKKVSANLARDSLDQFTAFQLSGLHRTAAEIADKRSVLENLFGAHISYQTSLLNIGINAVGYGFDKPLKQDDDPYRYFAFSGKRGHHISTDYSYTYRNLHLFGEAAVDHKGNLAWINGALISVDPRIDLSLLFRRLPMNYQSLYGNVFAESGTPSNEEGFYLGISFRPSAKIYFNAYADYFHFPWLKYRVHAPSRGSDYLIQGHYQPDRQNIFYIRYQQESKPLNHSGGLAINYPVSGIRQRLRLHYSTVLNRSLSLRSRVEMVWYDAGQAKETGFLVFAEAHWQHRYSKANLRLQLFDADSYSSRIYAYENDVLYYALIPAFFDKGLRFYVNLNHQLSKKLECWFRYSQSVYEEKKQLSGLSETTKDRSELRLQLIYRFIDHD